VASRSLLLAHAILLILATQSVAAAQGSGEIRGRVVNAASRTPIGIATVEVMDSAGGVRAHASTDADGSFRIEGLLPARYRVRILALGYTPRVLPVEISVASPSVDLGSVALTASALVLQPLQVTGQKRDVELAPDRTTYVVRDMPTWLPTVPPMSSATCRPPAEARRSMCCATCRPWTSTSTIS